MKKCFIITGTSSGIGKSLAELILKKSESRVIGLSRTSQVVHSRYSHVSVDLSSVEYVEKGLLTNDLSPLLAVEKITKIYLINNAATILPLGYIGSLSELEILKGMFLNAITPFILTNFLVKYAMENHISLTVLNIGTGASQRPLDGWSLYCASKASLRMQGDVWQLEASLRGSAIKFLEFVPGVVDTAMQASIREVGKDQFSGVNDFIGFLASGQLQTPSSVAAKILDFIRENEQS